MAFSYSGPTSAGISSFSQVIYWCTNIPTFILFLVFLLVVCSFLVVVFCSLIDLGNCINTNSIFSENCVIYNMIFIIIIVFIFCLLCILLTSLFHTQLQLKNQVQLSLLYFFFCSEPREEGDCKKRVQVSDGASVQGHQCSGQFFFFYHCDAAFILFFPSTTLTLLTFCSSLLPLWRCFHSVLHPPL